VFPPYEDTDIVVDGLNHHMRSNRVEKGLFFIPAYLASAGRRTARVSTHTCPQLLQSPARRYADATGAGRIASSALDTTIAGRWSRVKIRHFW
jgi:hypothetical protein